MLLDAKKMKSVSEKCTVAVWGQSSAQLFLKSAPLQCGVRVLLSCLGPLVLVRPTTMDPNAAAKLVAADKASRQYTTKPTRLVPTAAKLAVDSRVIGRAQHTAPAFQHQRRVQLIKQRHHDDIESK